MMRDNELPSFGDPFSIPGRFPDIHFYSDGGNFPGTDRAPGSWSIGHPDVAQDGSVQTYYFVKEQKEERAWLARTIAREGNLSLSQQEMESAISIVYEQIPVVNTLMAKRFGELRLGFPKPLTPYEVSLLTASEFAIVLDDHPKMHPLQKAAIPEINRLAGYTPDNSDFQALVEDGHVYLNVNTILEELDMNNGDLTAFRREIQNILYHENVHFQRRSRYPNKKQELLLASALYVNEAAPLEQLQKEFPPQSPFIMLHLSNLRKTMRRGNYRVRVEGGTVALESDELHLTRQGNFVEEAIVYYEAYRTLNPGLKERLEKLLRLPADRIPADIYNEVLYLQETIGSVKKWEDKAGGNSALMRAYYTGTLYNILLADVPEDEKLQEAIELLSKQFPDASAS